MKLDNYFKCKRRIHNNRSNALFVCFKSPNNFFWPHFLHHDAKCQLTAHDMEYNKRNDQIWEVHVQQIIRQGKVSCRFSFQTSMLHPAFTNTVPSSFPWKTRSLIVRLLLHSQEAIFQSLGILPRHGILSTLGLQSTCQSSFQRHSLFKGKSAC